MLRKSPLIAAVAEVPLGPPGVSFATRATNLGFWDFRNHHRADGSPAFTRLRWSTQNGRCAAIGSVLEMNGEPHSNKSFVINIAQTCFQQAS